MKSIITIWCFIIMVNLGMSEDLLPLTQRYFHSEDMGHDYRRGNSAESEVKDPRTYLNSP
jgi:hypothetical protein